MPDVNMSIFEEAQRNQLVTEVDIQTQVALDDYQVQLSDIANQTQSQDNVIIDRHGEFLPHWNESLDFDIWVKMSMEVAGKRLLMLSGNVGLSSGSSIDDTMIFGDSFNAAINTGKWDNTDGFSQADGAVYNTGGNGLKSISDVNIRNTIIETRIKSINLTYPHIHAIRVAVQPTETLYYQAYMRDNGVNGFGLHKDSAGSPFNSGAPLSIADTYHDYKLVFDGSSTINWYIDNGNLKTISNSAYTTGNIWMLANAGTGTSYFDYIFIRKYTQTPPTYTISIPKNISTALKSLGRAG